MCFASAGAWLKVPWIFSKQCLIFLMYYNFGKFIHILIVYVNIYFVYSVQDLTRFDVLVGF